MFCILHKDSYGTRDLIYDWKLDEHNGVELERVKLSQFNLDNYKISKKEIQFNDRLYLKDDKKNRYIKDKNFFFKGNHSVLQLDLRMRRSIGYYLLQ